ncbi:NADPH:quinone reductase-like Zn-dependent oxidoreductase [Actinoplanes lutulentus]|uniref:NADPH:quinone reductase-like Zn-dependent oxidoreductase n=1 Tax=Actinoplanes lutulentus TaxID=1287878 RepID=A0A327YYQ2_9ACTN|nr:NAD(P)-dependent alcohol dehydrogenase [Actinoplanes lutulentus]MBB2943463.1 NADPH:quinone reductase-like Zn-dependent oxidoreductase [Actinoplanes lutulentus]RAK26018.1 NADPH:quinone reductase-like Zn-dependent oxidoreductase [Actinoplanes lutulentus]
MRALVQDRYGSCSIRSIPAPVAGDGQVLVRVAAASVNAYDWHVMRGDPRFARLSIGLRRPKTRVRGRDFAGQVVAAGPGVSSFEPGDEVFGDAGQADGAFAEYIAISQDLVVHRPSALTPSEAAAIPLAGVTALQGLSAVLPGHTVLINGASGGVGTFAVQLATAAGAAVTAVCSTRNVELVKSLGASSVIDYRHTDFAADGARYDAVLDLVGNRSLSTLRGALSPGGTLILSGGGTYQGGSLLGPMRLILRAGLTSRLTRQRISILTATTSQKDLSTLAGMAADGRLKPVIDRTFPLAAAAEAISYLETEHARAKVVITV